jgi:hypothetical protein
MQALLWPIVTWILREVIIKFVVFVSIFALVAFLVPFAVQYLGDHIAPGALNGAFSVVGPGVWYFLDFFQLGYGLPLLISAGVSRFLIRRLPVIG